MFPYNTSPLCLQAIHPTNEMKNLAKWFVYIISLGVTAPIAHLIEASKSGTEMDTVCALVHGAWSKQANQPPIFDGYEKRIITKPPFGKMRDSVCEIVLVR